MLVPYESQRQYSYEQRLYGTLPDGRKIKIRFGFAAKSIAVKITTGSLDSQMSVIPIEDIIWCNPEVTPGKLRRLFSCLQIHVAAGEGADSHKFQVSFPSSCIPSPLTTLTTCTFGNGREFDDVLVGRIQFECKNVLSSHLKNYNAQVLLERYLRKALKIPQLMELCKMTVFNQNDREKAHKQAMDSANDYKTKKDECKKLLLHPCPSKEQASLQHNLKCYYKKRKALAEQAASKLYGFLFSKDPIKASMRRACFLESDEQGCISFKPADAYGYLLGLNDIKEDCRRVKEKLLTAGSE